MEQEATKKEKRKDSIFSTDSVKEGLKMTHKVGKRKSSIATAETRRQSIAVKTAQRMNKHVGESKTRRQSGFDVAKRRLVLFLFYIKKKKGG